LKSQSNRKNSKSKSIRWKPYEPQFLDEEDIVSMDDDVDESVDLPSLEEANQILVDQLDKKVQEVVMFQGSPSKREPISLSK
jgi:hypothetical protein